MSTLEPILVPYMFSHDLIMTGVKQEASLYAERRRSETGESLFDDLVFDEEYKTKFRELFFDAQAKVLDRYSPYLNYLPDPPVEIFEEADTTKNIDFTFSLLMPCDYNHHYDKMVSIKTREFIIAYIMYRWLETKAPQEAAYYKDRADNVLMDARAYLEKRIVRRRMTGGNMF